MSSTDHDFEGVIAAGNGAGGEIAGDRLARARARGLLSALDHRFAERLSALYGEVRDEVRWALALASRQQAAGHVCADLPRLVEDGLALESVESSEAVSSVLDAGETLEGWLGSIEASPLVARAPLSPIAVSQDEDTPRPLVLDHRGRLYLRRSHLAQAELARAVRDRVAHSDFEIDREVAARVVDRLTHASAPGDDAPTRALWTGLLRPLTVVTGGPGTGKTTMVARLIAALAELALEAGEAPPTVRLLAPTGKAAAAMTASFARQRDSLEASDEVLAALPTTSETIHRALHRQTRRDALGRPRSVELAEDVVVVDEASMVDLELMARLFEACVRVPRVVLLGDPDQLASVDSGAVLSEICSPPDPLAPPAPESSAGLAGAVVTLQTSHRFDASGGIGLLAERIRVGDADAVLALLADPAHPEVERCEADSIDGVRRRLVEESLSVHRQIEETAALGEKLTRMDLYRVLCAHRRGPLGVEALCPILDEAAARIRHTARRAGWWQGRMLLVTRNAPDQDLWNGDVGLIEQTPSGLRALFPDGAGGVRALSAGRLPAHESAIAMSVHKSQGSEFDVVDLVLGRLVSPLMTRELLYTGVTRARTRLRIHASEAALRAAVERRVQRDSGLAELLWAD